MTQAVLEGVAFALRDSFEVAKSLRHPNPTAPRSAAAVQRALLWKKIIANVLNVTVDVPKTDEGPGYGAAIASGGCLRRVRDLWKKQRSSL